METWQHCQRRYRKTFLNFRIAEQRNALFVRQAAGLPLKETKTPSEAAPRVIFLLVLRQCSMSLSHARQERPRAANGFITGKPSSFPEAISYFMSHVDFITDFLSALEPWLIYKLLKNGDIHSWENLKYFGGKMENYAGGGVERRWFVVGCVWDSCKTDTTKLYQNIEEPVGSRKYKQSVDEIWENILYPKCNNELNQYF